MDAQVDISYGRLQGRYQDGVFRFTGVPYAQDPVDELRFMPPVQAKPWAGVLDATQPTVIAPQTTSRLAAVMGNFTDTQSEACLRLTISTPGLDAKKRPVIVWLHGGGFSSGAGGLGWYDGSALASLGDVVVVGVNYRLGALGFLVAEGVSEGNLGLLDQAMALDYIRREIAVFGGDPDNLTLMGQSAGGNSIVALFSSGHDMSGVRRVILQSPALGMPPKTAQAARASGVAFLRALGLSPDAHDLRAQLQALPVSRILTAQAEVARSQARYGDTEAPFQLARTGCLAGLKDFPLDAADAMAGIDVLAGVTADEAHAFLMQDPHTQVIDFDEAVGCVRDIYGNEAVDRFQRMKAEQAGDKAGQLLSRLITREVFESPTKAFARRAHLRGNRAYFYVFDWRPETSEFKSCHCLELPFVFGLSSAWQLAPMLGDPQDHRLVSLVHTVQAAWLAFVRTGEPGADSLPHWDRYSDQLPAVMHIGLMSALRTEEGVLP